MSTKLLKSVQFDKKNLRERWKVRWCKKVRQVEVLKKGASNWSCFLNKLRSWHSMRDWCRLNNLTTLGSSIQFGFLLLKKINKKSIDLNKKNNWIEKQKSFFGDTKVSRLTKEQRVSKVIVNLFWLKWIITLIKIMMMRLTSENKNINIAQVSLVYVGSINDDYFV